VTHHRFGNAVRPIGFWELKELEGIFKPFLEEIGHVNVDAYKRVRHLMSKQAMSGVVVFVQHLDDNSCRGNPIYEAFINQLEQLPANVQQSLQILA
jgi:hypothetical protein